MEETLQVSIPFIAGQWSLRAGTSAPQKSSSTRFQSPSLRGSGRFQSIVRHRSRVGSCFNPLHCGAVVASRRRRCARRRAARTFQSPSLRGSGRFPGAAANRSQAASSVVFQSPSLRGSGRFSLRRCNLNEQGGQVSIPFIAGQWSLPSFQRSRPSAASSFNPLHCGAVVASQAAPARRNAPVPHVSIPFIAGQWSLRHRGSARPSRPAGFNPLHCGAVVASPRLRLGPRLGFPGFNPLHCGAVVASGGARRGS